MPIGDNLTFLINFIYLLIYILDSLLVTCVYQLLGFFVLIVWFFIFFYCQGFFIGLEFFTPNLMGLVYLYMTRVHC